MAAYVRARPCTLPRTEAHEHQRCVGFRRVPAVHRYAESRVLVEELGPENRFIFSLFRAP